MITPELLKKLVIRADKLKCPRQVILAIYNKDDYDSFLKSFLGDTPPKNLRVKFLGYYLVPILFENDNTHDDLADILIPASEKMLYPRPTIVLSCEAGTPGSQVTAAIKGGVVKGDTLIITRDGSYFRHLMVGHVNPEGNEIEIHPSQADESIPELDNERLTIVLPYDKKG